MTTRSKRVSSEWPVKQVKSTAQATCLSEGRRSVLPCTMIPPQKFLASDASAACLLAIAVRRRGLDAPYPPKLLHCGASSRTRRTLPANASTDYWPLSPALFPPPRWHARGVFGLDDDLRQIDVLVELALGELDAVLELGDLLLEQEDAGFELVGAAESRDLGIIKLALECREKVHRVAAAVGPGDLAFPLAEKGRILGLELGVGLPAFLNEVRGSYEDQVGEIDIAQPGLKHEDVIAPVFGIERVRGHGGQSPGVAQPVSRQRLELKNEQAGKRGILGFVLGLTLQDQQGLFHGEAAHGDLGLADHMGLKGREIM